MHKMIWKINYNPDVQKELAGETAAELTSETKKQQHGLRPGVLPEHRGPHSSIWLVLGEHRVPHSATQQSVQPQSLVPGQMTAVRLPAVSGSTGYEDSVDVVLLSSHV